MEFTTQKKAAAAVATGLVLSTLAVVMCEGPRDNKAPQAEIQVKNRFHTANVKGALMYRQKLDVGGYMLGFERQPGNVIKATISYPQGEGQVTHEFDVKDKPIVFVHDNAGMKVTVAVEVAGYDGAVFTAAVTKN